MTWFEEFLICLFIGVLLGYGAIVVIDTARDAAAAPCEAPATGWQPPNLQLCPEDITLWDCIRHAAYRSEFSK